jgi:hypothetical protein
LKIATGRSKVVYQYDLNNNYIAEYPSVRAAGRALNIDYTSIVRCCNGEHTSSYGFKWSYEKYE